MADQYTDEELNALMANAAIEQEEKNNAHSFLKKVVETEDTTKVGNLREEEVGIPKLSMRTLKELQLYCEDVASEDNWGTFFKKRAEILASTSLSKDAKLIDLAILSRKEVANVSKPQEKKVNKGWFGKRKVQPQTQM